jgi:hypothetical protein
MKPVYDSGFDLPEEGLSLMQIREVDFTQEEKGTLCKIKNEVIDHEIPSNIGLTVFDNFPLWTEFGKQRLLGLMVKAVGLEPKDYPSNYLDGPTVRAKIEKKMPSMIFGGVIKHSTSKGKEGKEGTVMANIKRYLTKDEMKAEMLKALDAKKTAPKETTKTEPFDKQDAGSTTGAAESDGW